MHEVSLQVDKPAAFIRCDQLGRLAAVHWKSELHRQNAVKPTLCACLVSDEIRIIIKNGGEEEYLKVRNIYSSLVLSLNKFK